MGRGVSIPSGAEIVCYQHREFKEQWDWDEYLEEVSEICKSFWPSLEQVDQWIDNENHVILENDLVKIGLSEYGGMISIWIIPKQFDGYDDYSGLTFHWISQIEPKFTDTFGELHLDGHMSNGVGVYSKVKRGDEE